MPGVRLYSPSDNTLESLRQKLDLGNKKAVLVATSGSMDYEQVALSIKKISERFPDCTILFRPHPQYGESELFSEIPPRVKIVNSESKYDLFMLADVVVSANSAMAVEAFCFTDNIIVITSDNEFCYNKELLKHKYPGFSVVPLCATEELMDKVAQCLRSPSRKQHQRESFDYRLEVDKMLLSIDQKTTSLSI
jgi:CDP-glycerol glycerophosphotransferase (TagB/SpsB family)